MSASRSRRRVIAEKIGDVFRIDRKFTVPFLLTGRVAICIAGAQKSRDTRAAATPSIYCFSENNIPTAAYRTLYIYIYKEIYNFTKR